MPCRTSADHGNHFRRLRRASRPIQTAFVAALATAASLAAAGGGAVAEENAAPHRPNVVFILTDDQRWDHMSCEGHPFLETPHMDRVAGEGARFTHHYVTHSLCSPSRASFLSGLYPHAHGVLNNFTEYPEELDSFPVRLHEMGYHTAYVGKWHMGEDNDERRPGFDYWVSHRGQGQYYDTEFNFNGERKVLEGYYTTRVTDVAVEWLREHREADRPFLPILGHKAPHTPFTPEEQYRTVYDHIEIEYPETAFQLDDKPQWITERLTTWHGIYGPLFTFRPDFPDTSPEGVEAFADFVRAYTATLLSVDDSLGRLYAALEEIGELDNTLLIFAGDNGMLLGEHGMTDKRAMQEPSIRTPLLVRYPPLIPAESVIDKMVLNIDVAPTIMEVVGGRPFEDIHGRSVMPLIRGETDDWRTAWYYVYNYERQFPYTPNVRGIRTERYKYMHYPHGDGSPDRHMPELYDMVEDPGETRNLVHDQEYAELIEELHEELYRLMDEAGALPDEMPIDEGIKQELPAAAIR